MSDAQKTTRSRLKPKLKLLRWFYGGCLHSCSEILQCQDCCMRSALLDRWSRDLGIIFIIIYIFVLLMPGSILALGWYYLERFVAILCFYQTTIGAASAFWLDVIWLEDGLQSRSRTTYSRQLTRPLPEGWKIVGLMQLSPFHFIWIMPLESRKVSSKIISRPGLGSYQELFLYVYIGSLTGDRHVFNGNERALTHL